MFTFGNIVKLHLESWTVCKVHLAIIVPPPKMCDALVEPLRFYRPHSLKSSWKITSQRNHNKWSHSGETDLILWRAKERKDSNQDQNLGSRNLDRSPISKKVPKIGKLRILKKRARLKGPLVRPAIATRCHFMVNSNCSWSNYRSAIAAGNPVTHQASISIDVNATIVKMGCLDYTQLLASQISTDRIPDYGYSRLFERITRLIHER